jgi:DNA-binding transcriptional MerR regulator
MYRIGEAARALNLQTSVLRFWEGEFPELQPVRTPKGQRLYTERDMEVLRKIRSLLHEQGMTIEGARRVLAGGAMPAKEVPAPKAQAAEGLPADVAALLRDALKELRGDSESDMLPILCFGSLYSAGDIRRACGIYNETAE